MSHITSKTTILIELMYIYTKSAGMVPTMGPAISGEGTHEKQTRNHRVPCSVPTEHAVQMMGTTNNPVTRTACLLGTAHAEIMKAETGQPCPVQLCKTASNKFFYLPMQSHPIPEVTQAKAGRH